MCGRMSLPHTAAEIMEVFEASHWDAAPPLAPSYNVAPSQVAAVLRQENESQVLHPMHWGLIPRWAKSRSVGYKMINARIETLTTKPAYRSLVQRKRCVAVAQGYYEWQKSPAGKTPFFITSERAPLLCFAALWDRWQHGENAVSSFTIITRPPAPKLAQIHNRMPALLTPQQHKRWLSPAEPPELLLAELAQSASDDLQFYPVSNFVNRPANNGPRCVEPAHKEPSLFDLP